MKDDRDCYIPERGAFVKTSIIKQQALIVLSILSCNFSFAQANYDSSILVGKYEGHPFDVEKGEMDEAVKVKAELSADFTLSLSIDKDGDRLETDEKINPKAAKRTENNSLEFIFEFTNTNVGFKDVYFNILPSSLGYEGIFITFVDSENNSLIFQMNRQGGNPEIPGAAEGLTGRELEEKLHQQFTALFIDAEKGFTFHDGEEEEGYRYYPSDRYLTHTQPAGIIIRDSGVSYYFTTIKPDSGADKWVYRDILIEAIESYPRSDGFRIVELEKRDYSKVYALKKSGKTVGFIEIKEDNDDWCFRLFIPLDSNKLKTELTKGVELAENNFRSMRGEKQDVFAFLGETTTYYKGTRTFYGAGSSIIEHSSNGNMWRSSFSYYPYAALAYQLDGMDLSFPDAREVEGEGSEKGVILSYEKPTFAFEITLLNHEKEATALWISRKRKSNTPVYVVPAKTYAAHGEYPAFSGSYEGDDLYQLMGRHWDDPAIRNWLNNPQYGFEKRRFGDSEFCIYDAEGIWLIFSKSHLTKIELFKNDSPAFGTFKGKLPKGIRLGAPASSIPVSWKQVGESYKVFEEDGVVTKVCFDPADQGKISEVQIRKEITVDAREDLETWNVGVGVSFSINNQGRVSVNNTQTGFSAKKAGLHEGMWILEIDGSSVQGKDEYDINKLLNGKKGSTVKVKFCRSYQEENAKEYLLYRGAGGEAELVDVVKSSTTHPPFNGQYGGDDLFLLLNRDFDDPVITTLINANAIKNINIGTDPNRKKMSGNGIGLEFYENKLIKISLSSYSFKGQLPQGLEFGMSPYEIKMSNQLKWTDHGEPYIYADYNEQTELRADFDANSDVNGTKLTFVYLKAKPEKITSNDSDTKTKQTSNDLVGLGFTYGQGKDSDVYEVDWLIESSAAYKAGVRISDNILKINGTPITGKPLVDVEHLINGKKGTSAKVIIERDGKEVECTVMR